MCVCVIFQLCCSTAVQLHDWFCCVEHRTGPPSSWLALRAAANCQDHFLLPSSLRFPAEQAGYAQTRLCSAAVDDAQRDPLLRRRSICLLRPARTYTVRVILAFTRVYRYTSSLSVQFRSLCHGFGMQRRCGLSRLFYKSQPEINFLSFCTQMGDTSEQPLLAAKVSTCIEILYNNLINIHVMANNWF